MAAKSKNKRAEARRKHIMQKRRAKYKAIMKPFIEIHRSPVKESSIRTAFEQMIDALLKLNIKHLEQLSFDLKDWAIPPWYGDYHKELKRRIDFFILEKTLLK